MIIALASCGTMWWWILRVKSKTSPMLTIGGGVVLDTAPAKHRPSDHDALALLAAQNEAHRPAIKRAIDFIRKKSIASIKLSDPKVGPKNWQAASSAILLAEYQLATGDSAAARAS